MKKFMKRLILVILVLTSFSAFADEEIVDDNTIVCNNQPDGNAISRSRSW